MERNMDRLSDLPDSILLHIMQFMDIKSAVQISLLSTRWKDLWKSLTSLTFHCNHFGSTFREVVSSILSSRDDSISLHKLQLCHKSIEPGFLNRVMTYAASHHVQQLSICVTLNNNYQYFEFPSSLFHCRSLTSLNLSFGFPISNIKLPKSLELPALKCLYMKNVIFATRDNGYVEPFSTCHMLNTLVIEYCYLESDAKVLCISNPKLFSLTIISDRFSAITLSTPNLNLLNILGIPLYRRSSTSNITCLEEVFIHFLDCGEFLIDWLRVLVHVKIMTLSGTTFRLLNALLSSDSIRTTQLPCFVRLKSLKLPSDIPDEEVSMGLKYLLQNSPLTRVDILKY